MRSLSWTFSHYCFETETLRVDLSVQYNIFVSNKNQVLYHCTAGSAKNSLLTICPCQSMWGPREAQTVRYRTKSRTSGKLGSGVFQRIRTGRMALVGSLNKVQGEARDERASWGNHEDRASSLSSPCRPTYSGK